MNTIINMFILDMVEYIEVWIISVIPKTAITLQSWATSWQVHLY